MNTVPFDQLGPGQSGRLAYQVLGQNGPIFNPNNIRYLSPDSPEMTTLTGAETSPFAGGASGLNVGLSGLNLIGSLANLAVAIAIYNKLDYLQETINRIEHKVDYIVEKVDRIDTQVAEHNLRHALEYVLQKAVSKEIIDLGSLPVLTRDINKFTESLSDPVLLNFGLRLSSDIRDRLQHIYNLAYGVRTLVACRHNTIVDGDPECIIKVDPINDYFCDDIGVYVKATLYFQKKQTEKARWLNFDNYLPINRCRELFPEDYDYEKVKDPESAEQNLYDLVVGWLYNTDSGLLYRTNRELEAISKGYEAVFWPELVNREPCGFDQIDIICDVPLLENS
ncbi:MAG: hypothetical protein F4Z30_18930 [Gemmatimonadetes bacterium]|nr:hypothetical protein [Gemmatimonadota bacterium]